MIDPDGAESQRGSRPGGRRPAAIAALIVTVAIISGAVSAGVSLAILRAQSRTNQQTVDLGSNVRINEESAVIQVVAHAAPAVVTIDTSDSAANRRLGSGFLITSDGYLVTNAHVVANASALTVMIAPEGAALGARHDARLVDSDCASDLAVLKVDGVRGLPTLAFADPGSLKVGQTVIAMGTPLSGNAVSRGIVSGLHQPVVVVDPVAVTGERRFADTIQADAVIDSRNSGGPLLNVAGEAVGILVGTTARGKPFGFAVSAADVRSQAEQIVRDGELVVPDLGMTALDQSAQDSALHGGPVGSLVTTIARGGPADLAGVRTGDVITALDEVKLDDAHPLGQVLVSRFRPAQRVTLTLSRQNSALEVSATLGRQHPRCQA